MNQERTGVFISYSHKDEEWLERLLVHLKPLTRSSPIKIWSDQQIKPGSKWQDEIENALGSTKVAVLLVSADFLASDYINHEELPELLKAAQNNGAIILPVIISASWFTNDKTLSQFQAVNSPDKPLVDMPRGEREHVFFQVTQYVEQAVTRPELIAEVNAVQDRLQKQEEKIETLVRYMLSASIFRHLCGIAVLKEYHYWHSDHMRREMYFLRDVGFIQPRGQQGFLDFTNDISGANLSDFVEPTPIGRFCLELRNAELPDEWLNKDVRSNLRVDQLVALGRSGVD